MKGRVIVVAVLCALVPAAALPQGELKAQIDAIDAQIAEANRLGRTGELRRLYAKGLSLLNGRPWTDAADYSASLVLRTARVVVDSSKPYTVRLEQIYAPSLVLQTAVTAHATLRKRPAPTAPNQPPPEPAVVKDLGTFEGVARDLRESPYFFDLDVSGVADGPYLLAVEVTNQGERIGSASLMVAVRKDLDSVVAMLERDANKAPESVRADVEFPIDRMNNVNRGRLELRTFDPDKDMNEAAAVVAAVTAGKDPFAGRTGDFKRHYRLEAAKEIIPYRLYVPTSYTGSTAYPLIVALHGLGGTEDSFFDGYNKVLPPLAESHGYIVAAPLGYRVDGSYGWGLGTPPADPNARRTQELSEQDVIQVLQRVRQQYKIDGNRIYLMGHSMGGIGTWKLAPKYPDIWAAIAPISGNGAPDTLEKIRSVPEIIVHGDADPTVNVSGSRTMVAKLKELGVEHKYIEVPGGLHSDVVAPNVAAIIDFFDAHRKASKPTSQP
jgi:poly(3-hydroxybutyrate) depolymerase